MATRKKKSEKPVTKSKQGLIIVESPAKAKTLKKYLGRSYDVKASIGHIKDLPKSSLGVDPENNFQPIYEVIKGKLKVVSEISKAAHLSQAVYLASDPDREGEAIAWHLAEEINLPSQRVHRLLFHEITKPAVLKAIENPLPLNKERYESQQARRILDRLVGYKISPILWTKVRRGLSAGRVQSVAVRIIVDREREIKAFIPKCYFSVLAHLSTPSSDTPFIARLVRIGEKKLERTEIDSEEIANEIVLNSEKANWKILSIKTKERRRNPYAPFITSTLQQESSKKLYFTAKKTMRVAQQLYEGVDVGNGDTQGLITYMRTDSTRLSDDALTEARAFISKQFGKDYLPNAPQIYKNKKNAQDAHEAIRPTSLELTPGKVKSFLDEDQNKLYELIWKRFIASQMEQAVFDQTTIELEARGEKDYTFRVSGSVLKFPGFLALWEEELEKDEDESEIPAVTLESIIEAKKVQWDKHFTQPPPRYSESSLIKELEEKGIGRPSTYAAILSTIQDRKYVEKKEGNRFFTTELGELVTDLLVENFSNIVDVQFTANMEEELDSIEEGKRDWVQILKEFYDPFSKTLKLASEKMRNVKREETQTDLLCPKCNKTLVLKWGRHGRFAACQGYPDCRFTSEFEKDGESIRLIGQQTTDEKCPTCGADMAIKTGRFGRFIACSNYPTCKTTKPITTGIKCPECNEGELSQKRTRFGKTFYSCTKYPACKYALWDKPIKTGCPTCQHPFLVERYTKKTGASIRCPNKECGYEEKAPETLNSPTGT